jgi:two-component system sensor histidine kinase ResE
MAIWRSVVGKLWITIILLVAFVLFILGFFLLLYIDVEFTSNSYEIKRLFVITSIIGFSLTTFFAFFLFSKITQPLRQLKRAADMYTMGQYETRLSVRSSDEIGQLTAAFNHLGEKLYETIRDLSYEKEHLSSILRSMTDAVVTFDANGKIISSNPHGEVLITTWAKITQTSLKDDIHPSINDTIPEPMQAVFQTVVADEKEVSAKLYVGSSGVWSAVLAPLYTNGRLSGVVAVLRNITEEDRLEKLRKDFVANVSHELRTPVSMLQGYSEALLDDMASNAEERQQIVQIIYEESLRMGRLVQDLLDLAKTEAGKLEFQMSNTDIFALVQRTQRKFLAIARERNLVFRTQVEEEREGNGSFFSYADEDRLEQVFTNLLDNAIRHTSSGHEITLYINQINVNGVLWNCVNVHDQGEGIPKEDLPYIFERFYKADKARRRNDTSGGTGLGLAIVKNIIDAHGGSVNVKSTLGQGTTFEVRLPATPNAISVEKQR